MAVACRDWSAQRHELAATSIQIRVAGAPPEHRSHARKLWVTLWAVTRQTAPAHGAFLRAATHQPISTLINTGEAILAGERVAWVSTTGEEDGKDGQEDEEAGESRSIADSIDLWL